MLVVVLVQCVHVVQLNKVELSCFRAVTIWFFEYNSLILTTGCSTWHLMAKKKRIDDLHKDGLGYKKFGNSLKPSHSTVAMVIQRFSKTGFTRNRPRSKKLSPCAVRQVQKLASKHRHMSAASIALEQGSQTQIGWGPLLWLTSHRRAVLTLKHKKKAQKFCKFTLIAEMLANISFKLHY